MTLKVGDLPPCPGRTGWPWDDMTHPLVPPRQHTGECNLKVSIVTVNYNGGQFLEETIRSVLLQNHSACEYIIIDGSSTDESLQIIKRYEPWLHYWVSEPDTGQPNAINKGLSRCTGSVIGILNSDDVYLPGALNCASRLFAADPGFDWLMGVCQVFDDARAFSRLWKPRQPTSIADLILGSSGPGQATFIRSTVIARVGFFEENLQYAFDSEYWMRMAIAGLRPKLTAAVLAKFRLHPTSKSCAEGEKFLADFIVIARRNLDALSLRDRERAIGIIEYLQWKQARSACLSLAPFGGLSARSRLLWAVLKDPGLVKRPMILRCALEGK